MLHHIFFRVFPCFSALFLISMLPALGEASDAGDQTNPARLRLICISSLAEDQQVVLASRDADGKWKELETVELRASLITEWLPAVAGELHLALRDEGILKSIGRFNFPAASRRALVGLVADPVKMVYETQVVDPESMVFDKGSMLILNFSTKAGLVSLGAGEMRVEAGRQLVAKPALDGNGMYGMKVSYLDADDKPVICHDRQVSHNARARSMMFLLSDERSGLRVHCLSMFGSLD